ncbi:Uncharacterised protein [Legionella geestiana]|nr:Uncharacterised protein [Legionella geestiana]
MMTGQGMSSINPVLTLPNRNAFRLITEIYSKTDVAHYIDMC